MEKYLKWLNFCYKYVFQFYLGPKIIIFTPRRIYRLETLCKSNQIKSKSNCLEYCMILLRPNSDQVVDLNFKLQCNVPLILIALAIKNKTLFVLNSFLNALMTVVRLYHVWTFITLSL